MTHMFNYNRIFKHLMLHNKVGHSILEKTNGVQFKNKSRMCTFFSSTSTLLQKNIIIILKIITFLFAAEIGDILLVTLLIHRLAKKGWSIQRKDWDMGQKNYNFQICCVRLTNDIYQIYMTIIEGPKAIFSK